MTIQAIGPSGTVANDSLFVQRGLETALRIQDVDEMTPFLMSVVSPSDHWLFVSSTGGVTLGRRTADHALLPYETDDRLHVRSANTGSVCALRVRGELWCPFGSELTGTERRRHLYKCAWGTWVELEEVADDLGLTYVCRWQASERYGFIRSTRLVRHVGRGAVDVDVIDGLIDVLPADVSVPLLQQMSTLVDAYKRAEAVEPTGLALYTLEAQITDHTVAVESLRANVVWSQGLPTAQLCLTPSGMTDFVRGRPHKTNAVVTGQRLAYLLRDTVSLDDGQQRSWQLIADVDVDHVQVSSLQRLQAADNVADDIAADVAESRVRLQRIVASADGLEVTNDPRANTAQFANVLFNSMRGGVFAANGRMSTVDLSAFVARRNRDVALRHSHWLPQDLSELTRAQAIELADATGDTDLRRLVREYLPLYFSRRHGDPSRPWNRFAIRLTDEEGKPRLAYEGNWRDIFQNWETLCASFPEYLPSIWSKFLNASTVDGFNPYRISDAGIDWEIPEPDNPWSNIGYWGDHQIAYLLRLLEASARHDLTTIRRALTERIFSYGAVPYRLVPFDALMANPKASITFDWAHHKETELRVRELGSDGRLLRASDGSVIHVTLAEKLLVPALSKLSNWVPDGGIWLNTQRPEWNDANNALAGRGLSVVTMCYLRKYLALTAQLCEGQGLLSVSVPVSRWFARIVEILATTDRPAHGEPLSPGQRMTVVQSLGRAFCDHRAEVYDKFNDTQTAIEAGVVAQGLRLALAWLDHSLSVCVRGDGLAHAYNVMSSGADGLHIQHLHVMLEGQVALLNSGLLNSHDTIALVDRLYDSPMFRQDQRSFMLYPIRPRPGFLDKNVIPAEALTRSRLLTQAVASNHDHIVVRDLWGQWRFGPSMVSVEAYTAALRGLSAEDGAASDDDVRVALEVYEEVFRHSSFTGRSGTMYKYEGVGCIYWHMVAKLLLSVQDACFAALDRGEDSATVKALVQRYYRLRQGLGQSRSAESVGAFPTDPYSHTPLHLGAQQPGMTGQVKEGVLCRQGELGWRVVEGCVEFRPRLLRLSEFTTRPMSWNFVSATGQEASLTLPPGSVAFTVCQVPVRYRLSDTGLACVVHLAAGDKLEVAGSRLPLTESLSIFRRDGRVLAVDVSVPPSELAS